MRISLSDRYAGRRRGSGARDGRRESAGVRALLAVLAHWFAVALAVRATWRTRRRGRDQLAQMSEYMLKDIGVTRMDVWRECRKWFWQP